MKLGHTRCDRQAVTMASLPWTLHELAQRPTDSRSLIRDHDPHGSGSRSAGDPHDAAPMIERVDDQIVERLADPGHVRPHDRGADCPAELDGATTRLGEARPGRNATMDNRAHVDELAPGLRGRATAPDVVDVLNRHVRALGLRTKRVDSVRAECGWAAAFHGEQAQLDRGQRAAQLVQRCR